MPDSPPTSACEACGDADCPNPLIIEGRPDGHRNCEADGCHEQHDQSAMYRLFREFWYCREHATEQLAAAASERALDEAEKELALDDLDLHDLPGGAHEREPEEDAIAVLDLTEPHPNLEQELRAILLDIGIPHWTPTTSDLLQDAARAMHEERFDTWTGSRFAVYPGWNAPTATTEEAIIRLRETFHDVEERIARGGPHATPIDVEAISRGARPVECKEADGACANGILMLAVGWDMASEKPIETDVAMFYLERTTRADLTPAEAFRLAIRSTTGNDAADYERAWAYAERALRVTSRAP